MPLCSGVPASQWQDGVPAAHYRHRNRAIRQFLALLERVDHRARAFRKTEVPFTSFSEYDTVDRQKVPVWFALGEERPLAFFAGLWTEWTSTRKKSEGEVTADLFGFLTCEPSEPVKAIHPKAMPVVLTEPDELEAWMTASWDEAKGLQRPLVAGVLRIVARGERKDR